MTQMREYKLPDAIPMFIAEGKASAESAIKRVVKKIADDTKENVKPITLKDLAQKAFAGAHNEGFFRASRNEPANLDAEGLRDNLQTMIKAAACLCEIAYRLRHHTDYGPHKVREFLRNGAKDFYLHHTQHELHPRILCWLDAAMTDEERKMRPQIVGALRGMFPTPEAPPADKFAPSSPRARTRSARPDTLAA